MFGEMYEDNTSNQNPPLSCIRSSDLVSELKRRGGSGCAPSKCPHEWKEEWKEDEATRICEWCGSRQQAIIVPAKIAGWK